MGDTAVRPGYAKAIWQFGALGLTTVMQVGQLFMLARILPPAEFGVVAIVNVVMAIIQVFSDFGASNYLIYKKDMSRQELSSLYWLNVLVGGAGCLLIMLSAYPVAHVYHNAALVSLLCTAAFSFLVTSFSSQFQTLLIRDFKLDVLARMEALSRLVGMALTIRLALDGWGAMSIVLGQLAGTAIKVVYQCLMTARQDYPLLHFSLGTIREGVSFGMSNIGARIVNAIRMNADTALVGLHVPAHDLGLFSAARQLISSSVNVFNPLVARMAIPYFAGAKGNEDLLFRVDKAYQVAILSIVPLYAFAVVMSQPIVDALLGEHYHASAGILAAFALFWMVRLSVGGVQSALVQALGRSDMDMKWALTITPVHLGVVLVFSRYGVDAIAIALAVMQIGASALAFRMVMRNLCEYSALRLLRHVLAAVVLVSVPAFAATWLVSQGLPLQNKWLALGASMVVYVAVAFLMFYVVMRSKKEGFSK